MTPNSKLTLIGFVTEQRGEEGISAQPDTRLLQPGEDPETD
jgi:hypothetical protein